jgi:NAD(P)-dependent dehydrogenase (short-subunit alcohol dehydrogenase family)
MASILGMDGKAALVVGGGLGMGRASSLLLSRAGCRVALVDTERERAEAVAAEIRAEGGEAHALVADVTVDSQAEGAVRHAAAALGGLDTLVNIVGGATWGSLLDSGPEHWDQQMSLNLRQHWVVCRAVARAMEQGGTMVVVASASGLFAAPDHGPYGAAKAGLMGLVKTMSEEWWERGIRINAIAPGAVRTPRMEGNWERGEIPRPKPDVLDRMSLPEDIAGVALFLSSDLARRVSGQTVVVDGGHTVRFPFALD